MNARPRPSAAPLATMLLALAVPCAAGTLEGSPHDFSRRAWAPQGQLCVLCHTPVRVGGGVLAAPLWSRPGEAGYRVYASPTLDAVPGQPGSLSKVCLSCHDGSVAVDSFGEMAPRGPVVAASRDLTGSHPIGLQYGRDLAHRDRSLFDPSLRLVTIGSGGKQKSGHVEGTLLYDGRLECSSCHDPHNIYTVPAGVPGQGNKLLKMGMGGSAICLACHDK